MKIGETRTIYREKNVNPFLDAAVQFIQMTMLLIVVAQNLGLRARLKRLEDRLGRGT